MRAACRGTLALALTKDPLGSQRPIGMTTTTFDQALATRLENAGKHVSRWGLAVILFAFGAFKFTAAEAAGIRPMAENSPVFGWLYRLTSPQAVSNVIGVIEIVIAVLLATHRWSPRAAALGGVGAMLTFATTLSFLVTTPNVGADPTAVGFLMKDVFLFGAALVATAGSLKAIERG